MAESKSPDKYTINKNLVVNLNDSIVKPFKRENSNTTNATHTTGVTSNTAGTQNTKNGAFYNTQYNKQGFFNNKNHKQHSVENSSVDPNSPAISNHQQARQVMGTAGTQDGHPQNKGRFRSIPVTSGQEVNY